MFDSPGIDEIENEFSEEFLKEQLKKITAPLRLQSPLRPEPIIAAYSGNYSNLGCREEEKKICKTFHDYIYPRLAASGKKPIIDGSKFLAMVYIEGWTNYLNTPGYNLEALASLAIDLTNKQEAAYTCGLSKRELEKSDLTKLSTETHSLFNCRQHFQDILLTYVDHTDGKSDYRPINSQLNSGWYQWKHARSNWTFYYLENGPLYAESPSEFFFIPMNTMKCLYEVICARFLICLACDLATIEQNPLYPTTAIIKSFLTVGDLVLINHGDLGFDTLKLTEGLVIGNFLQKEDPGLLQDPCIYLNTLTADVYQYGSESEKHFCSEIGTIVSQLDNPHQVFQLFGLFRLWGYPHVNTLAGINKVRNVACQVKSIDLNISRIIRYMAQETIFMSYFKQNGHYPPHVIATVNHNSRSSIIISVQSNLPIVHSDVNYSLEDWEYIIPKKLYNPEESLSTLDLLQDKACSGSLTETFESLKSTGALPSAKKRRTLLKYLSVDHLDCVELLNNINCYGFPADELLIGVTPKEREVKTVPRLFSLMPLTVRTYFTATEHLLAETILPHFPEIAMGLNMMELKRILSDVARNQKNDGRPDKISVALNFDFERWNLNERGEALFPLFQLFDQLFGYDNVFNRTHEFFSSAVYYCADQYLLPDPDALLNGKSTETTWVGHYGGMEGLRQKGWTIGTVMLIRYIERKSEIKSRLLGQGDNQILLLDYIVNRYAGCLDETEYFRNRARTHLNEFLTQLTDAFQRIGLPIKLSESWTSEILFAYGKETYVRGIKVSLALKRLSRMFFISNELHPTFFHTVGSIFSTAEAVAENDIHPRISLICAICELSEAYDLYRRWSPLRGKGIWLGSPPVVPINPLPGQHYMPLSQQTVERIMSHPAFILECLLLGSHDFGGYPTQNYYSLSVRGFSDPLALSLGFCQAYLKYNDVHPLVRQFLTAHYTPLLDKVPQPSLCLTDPLGLNLLGPSSFVSKIKKFGLSILKSGLVKNRDVITVQSCAESDLTSLVKFGLNWNLFLPRFINILAENSPAGIADKIISKFQNATTLQKAARALNPGGANSLESTLGNLDYRTFGNFIYTGCKMVRTQLFNDDLICYNYLQVLRSKSFGVDQVFGVTSPLPLSYGELYKVESGVCMRCVMKPSDPFCSIVCNSKFVQPIWTGRTVGPNKAYEGSTTVQKRSSFSPWRVTTKSSAYQCAKRLASYRGWIIQPNSEIDKYIEKIIGTLTNVPYNMISQDTITVTSSASHRLLDPRSHNTSYPGNLLESYTAVNVSTNTMAAFANGVQDRPINFQSLISYCQTIPIILFSSDGGHCSNYHFHITSVSEVPELDDFQIDMIEPNNFPLEELTLYSLPESKLLYADINNLSITYRPAALARPQKSLFPQNLPDTLKNLIFNYSCSQMLYSSLKFYSDINRLGVPPDTSLPYIYYVRSDPLVVLNYLVRMAMCSACNKQWAFQSDKHYVAFSLTTLDTLWVRTINYLTALNDQAISCIAGYFSIKSCRQTLLNYLPPHIAPRDNPISITETNKAAKRALVFFANECRLKQLGPCEPNRFEFVNTRMLFNDYLDNFVCSLLQQHKTLLITDIKRLIREGLRALNASYNVIMEYGKAISPDNNFSHPFWLRKYIHGLSESDTQLIIQCLSETTPKYRIMTTSNTLKIFSTPYRPTHVACHFVGSYNCQIVGSLRTIRLNQLIEFEETLDLRDDWLPIVDTPQYKACTRYIHAPTVAWPKWMELIQEVIPFLPEYPSVAAVGDGCGGVTMLCKLMIQNVDVTYNSLQHHFTSAMAVHTESYPTALEAMSLDQSGIKGCSINTQGVSDITDPSWPAYFLSVSGRCNAIFCDANYGKHAGDGVAICRNILAYLELCQKTGSEVVAIIMKSYFYTKSEMNDIIHLIHCNFNTVLVRQSVFSGAGSSECFITGLDVRDSITIPHKLIPIQFLIREECEKAISNSMVLNEDIVTLASECVDALELLCGKMLRLPELDSVLKEFAITHFPTNLQDAMHQIQLNMGECHTLDHLHTQIVSNTQLEMTYNRLQEVGGLLILLTMLQKKGKISKAIKYLFSHNLNWLVFVGKSLQPEVTGINWIVWVSPNHSTKYEVYQHLKRVHNKVSNWFITMASISHDYWFDGRSKSIFQTLGLITSVLKPYQGNISSNQIIETAPIDTKHDINNTAGLLTPRISHSLYFQHTHWQL